MDFQSNPEFWTESQYFNTTQNLQYNPEIHKAFHGASSPAQEH